MALRFCLLLLLLIICFVAGEITIARGTVAQRGDFPSFVFILQKSTNAAFCGGTLVHPDYVITAAHCFDNAITASNIYMVFDRLNPYDVSTGFTRDASHSVRHPGYQEGSYIVNNDIAVIRLSQSVNASQYVQYADLERQFLRPGSDLLICGLGLTESGTTTVLRKAQVPITTANFCEQHGTYYDSSQLCAGDGSGRDACQGDSGGPAGYIRNGDRVFVLAGITSWGPSGCGGANAYGAYTRVSNYIPWIRSYIPAIYNYTEPQSSSTKPSTDKPLAKEPIVIYVNLASAGHHMPLFVTCLCLVMFMLVYQM